ncbi:ISAs1 family transposase [Bacteroidales bacterium]|nr:ISAs1 family transposase [Bacteroidales bacterium]
MAKLDPDNQGRVSSFIKYFSALEDPRCTTRGNYQHLLSDIMFLSISAILCGADNWELIHAFGNNQIEWLKKYGNFSNGIPSSDTLSRVFTALEPKSFNECFLSWIESLRKKTEGEVVAIDGKSIRGANPKSKNNMPHIVSAFAVENGLTLGQLKVNEKSNEITAIPELLELIAIEGCTITIDAMGCQTKIAETIIENKADYILAVKGNQGNLEQSIIDTIRFEKPISVNANDDYGHSRLETRTCQVYNTLDHIKNPEKWKDLRSIIKVESKVHNTTSGKTTTEERYYISNLALDSKVFNDKIRKHWAIENNLHWTLDVEFGEDKSRKRTGYQAENFNVILKMAMAILTKDKSKKMSKRTKRMQAAWDSKYRDKLLTF